MKPTLRHPPTNPRNPMIIHKRASLVLQKYRQQCFVASVARHIFLQIYREPCYFSTNLPLLRDRRISHDESLRQKGEKGIRKSCSTAAVLLRVASEARISWYYVSQIRHFSRIYIFYCSHTYISI